MKNEIESTPDGYIKKLIPAWDSDYTKLMKNERIELGSVNMQELYTRDEFWKYKLKTPRFKLLWVFNSLK